MKIFIQKIIRIIVFTSLVGLWGCYENAVSVPSSDTGMGGSLARFTVVGNFLYVVDFTSLKVYNVSSPENPTFVKEENIGLGIETIFPFAGKLFIGSQQGMFIYNILADGTPQYLSAYEHVLSCDPVTTNGDYAYVTLRSGGNCRVGFWANQLEIIDVRDLSNPVLVSTWDMVNPWGVGVDGHTLFVCEGDQGLKIFDVTDPINIQLITHITDIRAFDVIVLGGTVLVVSPDNVYQYDYSDLNNIFKISELPIEA